MLLHVSVFLLGVENTSAGNVQHPVQCNRGFSAYPLHWICFWIRKTHLEAAVVPTATNCYYNVADKGRRESAVFT
jgi:hypothetical protein